jgi:hypothetical protein
VCEKRRLLPHAASTELKEMLELFRKRIARVKEQYGSATFRVRETTAIGASNGFGRQSRESTRQSERAPDAPRCDVADNVNYPANPHADRGESRIKFRIRRNPGTIQFLIE